MQILPVDITSVIAVIMGISIVLIPVIGLTARFALKPVVEALSRLFETRGNEESVQMLERRVAFLEAQIEHLEGSVNRLDEATTFDAELRSGPNDEPDRLPSP